MKWFSKCFDSTCAQWSHRKCYEHSWKEIYNKVEYWNESIAWIQAAI